ncbi:SymE family type I addiction module toxin [Limibacter armeniacum]|uniref:SymE family type I addiction module toxin n=1 Tax=Limibacter armeniacum TaxID=466084 RepID=UPI002FE57D2E
MKTTFKIMQRKYYRRRFREVCFPSLALEGKQLQTAGFAAGEKVKVSIEHHKITIEKC